MRIVKVLGGLGNQMFQFALYKALQKQHPEERVLLDLHCFNGYHKHRGFEIESVFGATYEKATLKEVASLAYPYPNYQCWRIGSRILPVRKTMLKEEPNFMLEPSALSLPDSTYYDGYWQHEEYFKHIREEILSTYAFPAFDDERNKKAAQLITTSNSCSVHVRRGDYISDQLFCKISDTNYYTDAIKKMIRLVNPSHFFIFSDDIPWCKAHFNGQIKDRFTFIDWNNANNSIHDMHLMSLCKHHIIANSSFSWWGAWLSTNPSKKIIAPSNWWNRKDSQPPYANSWLIL